jgi:hypothetical protein
MSGDERRARRGSGAVADTVLAGVAVAMLGIVVVDRRPSPPPPRPRRSPHRRSPRIGLTK